MKTTKIITSLALSICVASLLGCTKPETSQLNIPSTKDSTEAELLRTGLAERIRIEGQEVDFQSLAQRQALYNVPGVSVAYMKNGQLAWTLEHGVKDVASGLVVDEDTVFQAGSISKPAFATVLRQG